MAKITKSDEEWKKTLSAEEYRVLRQSGTERAFTGTYWNNHEPGRYMCAGCGHLFGMEIRKLRDGKFREGCRQWT